MGMRVTRGMSGKGSSMTYPAGTERATQENLFSSCPRMLCVQSLEAEHCTPEMVPMTCDSSCLSLFGISRMPASWCERAPCIKSRWTQTQT
eukprot:52750-Eustigmatos_ZCMA.PRE.1